jgi:hypothetical protein
MDEGAVENAREALRRSFRPALVRVLFVGESPPAGGTFFYAADSGLYRATRDAFEAALPGRFPADRFLECFAQLGCYLEDLSHEPVNQLTARSDGSVQKRITARRDGEARLAKVLAALRPRAIVVLLKAIAPNVARAATQALCSETERYVLTYPSRWHRHRVVYRSELAALVRDLVRRGILEATGLR